MSDPRLVIFESELVSQFLSYHALIRKIAGGNISLRPNEIPDLNFFILVFLGSCAGSNFGDSLVCPRDLVIFEMELTLQFWSYNAVIRNIAEKNTSLRPKEAAECKSSILVFSQHDSHDNKSTS